MINAIFSTTSNFVFSINNHLPYVSSSDLNWFKSHTVGNTVIMGRNTFESQEINKKPLPNRKNWIITSSMDYYFNGVNIWANSPIELCKKLEKEDPSRAVFVIGGKMILESMAGMFDKVYYTQFKREIKTNEYNNCALLDVSKILDGYKSIYVKTAPLVIDQPIEEYYIYERIR